MKVEGMNLINLDQIFFSDIIILTLLWDFSNFHFSRGAHWVNARVSVTGVGSFIWWLYIIQDQTTIRWHQDAATIWTYRDTVPIVTMDEDIKVDNTVVFDFCCSNEAFDDSKFI